MSTEPDGHASTSVTPGKDREGYVPIGHILAQWRKRRGIAVRDVALRSGLAEHLVNDIEAGRDWVDRHSVLCSPAGSLQLDPLDLTGQPYAPYGEQHVAVRAVAWHLRHLLYCSGPRTIADGQRERSSLLSAAEEVRNAQATGDDYALALVLPRALEAADRSGSLEGGDRPVVGEPGE